MEQRRTRHRERIALLCGLLCLGMAGLTGRLFFLMTCRADEYSSMATELIKGKPLSQALELTNKAVAEALDGLPAYKMHCSVLAEEAIKAALADYYRRQGREVPEALRLPCEDEEHGCCSCGH